MAHRISGDDGSALPGTMQRFDFTVHAPVHSRKFRVWLLGGSIASVLGRLAHSAEVFRMTGSLNLTGIVGRCAAGRPAGRPVDPPMKGRKYGRHGQSTPGRQGGGRQVFPVTSVSSSRRQVKGTMPSMRYFASRHHFCSRSVRPPDTLKRRTKTHKDTDNFLVTVGDGSNTQT
jgi:hypothetical protein